MTAQSDTAPAGNAVPDDNTRQLAAAGRGETYRP